MRVGLSRKNGSVQIKLGNIELKEVSILNNSEMCQQEMVIAKGKSRQKLSLPKKHKTDKYHS
jgi:hypothetical protein